MSGVKVDFIGQLIIDTRITLTEGAEASSKQLVADTLFTAIKVVLYQFLLIALLPVSDSSILAERYFHFFFSKVGFQSENIKLELGHPG